MTPRSGLRKRSSGGHSRADCVYPSCPDLMDEFDHPCKGVLLHDFAAPCHVHVFPQMLYVLCNMTDEARLLPFVRLFCSVQSPYVLEAEFV